MTNVLGGVGFAHPEVGYRLPVVTSRTALVAVATARPLVGAARRRRRRRSVADAWEDHLSAPWSSFCDDEGQR